MPRLPRLSLDLLRGFRAAARHLSFTRAAEELFVTQSAVSREIRTLEEQLGQLLFRRVNRTLQLTSAGEQLYRATDEALSQIDDAVHRLAGSGNVVAVTTTPALASLWLAPRLPRFNRDHPGVDVRVVASNDRPDLERDQLDVAIRFVATGGDVPDGERLMECRCFPVCSPELARNKSCPIRMPSDLAHHVRLDYEALRDGRRLSEWNFWFDAVNLRRVHPVSTLQFPQYDQVVAASVEGSGVAMGVLPHVLPYLREGVLRAPFGAQAVAHRGTFFIVRRPDVAQRKSVQSFIAWLWSEVKRDGDESMPATRRRADTPPGARPQPTMRKPQRAR